MTVADIWFIQLLKAFLLIQVLYKSSWLVVDLHKVNNFYKKFVNKIKYVVLNFHV